MKDKLTAEEYRRIRREGLEVLSYSGTINLAEVPSFLKRQIKAMRLRVTPLRSRNTKEFQGFLRDHSKVICLISLVASC